jgi:outer membrane lipoprotein LolB
VIATRTRTAVSSVFRGVPAGLVATLAALLLAACASLPVPSPVAPPAGLDWPQRRAQLQQRADFSLKGRIAVAAGEEGFSAGLRWAQRDREGLIELDGPLGIGGLRLQVRGEALELTTSRGERLDGAAARVELERRLGFALPLASLRYWVRGVPDPATPADETVDPAAPRLAGLAQGGWTVDYAAYVEDPAAGALPRRLSAVREGTRLRLVIEAWTPGAAP